MRGVALVAAGVACLTAGSAVAEPQSAPTVARRPDISLPLEGMVTKPDWVEKPNGDDFANYYPRIPELLGISGRTLMRCDVSATGTLENCNITQEQPAGLGFGDAALKISQFFRMKPMSVDGAPVAGAKINIPITFAGPPSEAESPSSPPASPQPSAKALELARRVAATGFGPAEMDAYAARLRNSILERQFGASLTEQEQAALDDYVQAMRDSAPQRAEALAQRLAREFTEAQLTEIATFLESPTGIAWTHRGQRDAARAAADNARIDRALTAAAKSRFCSKYDCLRIDGPVQAAAKE